MSSTTDRRIRAASRTLGLAGAIAAGWFAANAGILAVTEEADAVLVLFAHQPGAVALPDSVAILDWDGHSGRFVGRQAGYIADLYRAGALVVLPARGGGCLAMLRQADGGNGARSRADPFVASARQDTDGRRPATYRMPAPRNNERT